MPLLGCTRGLIPSPASSGLVSHPHLVFYPAQLSLFQAPGTSLVSLEVRFVSCAVLWAAGEVGYVPVHSRDRDRLKVMLEGNAKSCQLLCAEGASR